MVAFRADFAVYRRRQLFRAWLIGSTLVVLTMIASYATGFTPLVLPEFVPGFFRYVDRMTPDFLAGPPGQVLAGWFWNVERWISLLFDTILMAFFATLLGTTGALLLCFPASSNLSRNPVVYFLCRRLLEFLRAVPDLVFAMIFVFAFGIGPLAGILAIGLHAAGALGKLYYEVNENVDLASLEGVESTGANRFEVIVKGILPQVLPAYLSYGLLRFEINVRSAAIIGLVGAGGIGADLYESIRGYAHENVGAILVLIIAVVVVIDLVCERLRHAVIGAPLGAKA